MDYEDQVDRAEMAANRATMEEEQESEREAQAAGAWRSPVAEVLSTVPSSPLTDEEAGQAFRFIAPFWSASMEQTARISTQVSDNLAMNAAISEAALSLVRERVHELFDGPHLPNPARVISALYPPMEDIKRLAEELLHNRKSHSGYREDGE